MVVKSQNGKKKKLEIYITLNKSMLIIFFLSFYRSFYTTTRHTHGAGFL